MPQINQLSEILISQLFWLAIVFGIIYFVIGRGMVPKIRGTVGDRESRIASDLERAQAAREEADRTEEDWRARMNEARAEASRVTQEAKAASSRDLEAKLKKAADRITRKVEDAEAKIRAASNSARKDIESVASEGAQDMVRLLIGIDVEKKEADLAVKAVTDV